MLSERIDAALDALAACRIKVPGLRDNSGQTRPSEQP